MSADVHALSAPWEMTWNGARWENMPGYDVDSQKLNFALFRRGLLELVQNPETGDWDHVASWECRRRTLSVGSVGTAEAVGGMRTTVRAARREARVEMLARFKAERERAEREKLSQALQMQDRVEQLLAKGVAQRGLCRVTGLKPQTLTRLLKEGMLAEEPQAKLLAKLPEIERAAADGQIPIDLQDARTVCDVPPGHVPLKDWLLQQAERLGLKLGTLRTRIWRGQYRMPPLLRLNERRVFVQLAA